MSRLVVNGARPRAVTARGYPGHREHVVQSGGKVGRQRIERFDEQQVRDPAELAEGDPVPEPGDPARLGRHDFETQELRLAGNGGGEDLRTVEVRLSSSQHPRAFVAGHHERRQGGLMGERGIPRRVVRRDRDARITAPKARDLGIEPFEPIGVRRRIPLFRALGVESPIRRRRAPWRVDDVAGGDEVKRGHPLVSGNERSWVRDVR
jgi:hypothetical protein